MFDRGVAIFEAVAVAMAAFKRGDDDLNAARSAFNKIIDELGFVMRHENLAILLRHDTEDIKTGVERTMRREDDHPGPSVTRYAPYRRLLQTELFAQEARGLYQHTIRVSERSGGGGERNEPGDGRARGALNKVIVVDKKVKRLAEMAKVIIVNEDMHEAKECMNEAAMSMEKLKQEQENLKRTENAAKGVMLKLLLSA